MAVLFKNLPEKFLSAFWLLFALGSLFQLNFSLFVLLRSAAEIRGDFAGVLPIALSELTKVLLEGTFFFTWVFPVGSKTVIVSKKTRTDWRKTLRGSIDFLGVKAWGIVTGAFALLAVGAQIPDNWSLFLSLAIALPWGIARCIGWLKRITAHYSHYEYLEDMSVASTAIKKIRSSLSRDEQNELARAVYQSNEMSRSTAINLARYVCGGLVVSIIISLVQELIASVAK